MIELEIITAPNHSITRQSPNHQITQSPDSARSVPLAVSLFERRAIVGLDQRRVQVVAGLHDFLRRARAARRRQPGAHLRVERVEPIPTTAYPTPAQRPAYSVLDCSKIQTVFGITPRPWRDSLHDCMQEWPQ